jgi:hypothetical protein
MLYNRRTVNTVFNAARAKYILTIRAAEINAGDPDANSYEFVYEGIDNEQFLPVAAAHHDDALFAQVTHHLKCGPVGRGGGGGGGSSSGPVGSSSRSSSSSRSTSRSSSSTTTQSQQLYRSQQ